MALVQREYPRGAAACRPGSQRSFTAIPHGGFPDGRIAEFAASDGSPEAMVTRNSYGSLVLNTARVIFVDVDLPPTRPGAGLARLAAKFFGGAAPATPEQQIESRFQQWSSRNPDFSGRLYRTCAGYRWMVTNRLLDPEDRAVEGMLEELGADPLYRKLCKVQRCFRARLTPKYWRCGGTAPPNRYPWESAADEESFRRWQHDYERLAAAHATCRLVDTFGDDSTPEAVQRILQVHDDLTRVAHDLPMA